MLRLRTSILALALTLACTGTAHAQTLARYTLTPGWATFGLALPQGAVRDGVSVGALQTQTDIKTKWPDGSIRFAIVTARIADAGTYDIRPGSASSGDFSESWPNVAVDFQIGGSTSSATPSGAGAVWLNGPLVREMRWVQGIPGATGAAANLRVIFDIRQYREGGSRLDVTVNNNLNVSGAREVAYGVTVRANDSSLFSRTTSTTGGPSQITSFGAGDLYTSANHGLAVHDYVRLTSGAATGMIRQVIAIPSNSTVQFNYPLHGSELPVAWERITFLHPYLARWRKTFAIGGLVEAGVTPDLQPFEQAKALPRYLSSIAGPVRNISGPKFDILRLGDLVWPLNMTGDRPDIGLLPAWAAEYMVHKRADQRDYLLAMGSTVAGAIGLHIDEPDGSMLSLDKHLTFFLAPPGTASGNEGYAGGGPGGYGVVFSAEGGSAHTPSLSYLPYLLTGDHFYLDEMKYWANHALLSMPWMRDGRAGIITNNQVRDIAWALRNIADAAAYTPDTDAHKAYFTEKLLNNINDLNAKASREPDTILNGSLFGAPRNWSQQMFMQSYVAWALDHVAKQGFPASAYLQRLLSYWNSLYNAHPAFDKRFVISYVMYLVHPDTGQPFPDYAAMFNYNLRLAPLTDRWDRYNPPDGVPQMGTSYGVNAYVLLALAAEHGVPQARANLTWLLNDQGGALTPLLNVRSQYAIASSTTPPKPKDIVIIK